MNNTIDILKSAVEDSIREKVDEIIEEKVKYFREQLKATEDDVVSGLMKGIRITQEFDSRTMSYQYNIVIRRVE